MKNIFVYIFVILLALVASTKSDTGKRAFEFDFCWIHCRCSHKVFHHFLNKEDDTRVLQSRTWCDRYKRPYRCNRNPVCTWNQRRNRCEMKKVGGGSTQGNENENKCSSMSQNQCRTASDDGCVWYCHDLGCECSFYSDKGVYCTWIMKPNYCNQRKDCVWISRYNYCSPTGTNRQCRQNCQHDLCPDLCKNFYLWFLTYIAYRKMIPLVPIWVRFPHSRWKSPAMNSYFLLLFWFCF